MIGAGLGRRLSTTKLASWWRRREALVITSGLVATTQMSWGAVIPVLPAYGRIFGVTVAELGLVVAVFGLGRVLANVPAGWLSDRVDRNNLLLGSVLLVALLTFLSGLAATYWQLILLRLLTGAFGGVAITAGQTQLSAAAPRGERGRAMATLQGIQLAAATVGPSLGGLAADLFGVRAAFYAAALAAAAVVAVASTRRRAEVPAPLPRLEPGGASVGGAGGTLWTAGFLAACLTGFAVFLMRFGGQQFLMPLIAVAQGGLTPGNLGLAMTAISVANILMLGVVGRLADSAWRRGVIVTSLAGAGVLTAGYAAAHSAFAVLGILLLIGLFNGFNGPSSAAYLADAAPSGREGRAIGVYRTFGDAATLTGPLTLGWLAERAGLGTAAVVLGAIAVACAALFAAMARDPARGPA